MKSRKYALFFFETLIQRLISDHELATCEQSDLVGHIKTERLNFQIAIKKMVISTTRTRELRHFLNQHYLDLNNLQELLQAKQQKDHNWHLRGSELLEVLLSVLAQMKFYLQERYGFMFELHQLPFTANMEMQFKELSSEFQIAKDALPPGSFSVLLKKHIQRIIDRNNLGFILTKSSLDYMFTLVRCIKDWNWSTSQCPYTPIERLMVYLNFNSKAVIDQMVGRMKHEMELKVNPMEKLLFLLNCLRALKQLHRKPGIALNPNYRSIDVFIKEWIDAEVTFIRSANVLIHSSDLPSSDRGDTQCRVSTPKSKLRCSLSVDQLAIIFRAVDETKLVEARSLNQVYHSIVPFLSTPNRVDISPASMRVKSYHPEERDKQLVIEKLQQMISRINSY